MSTRSLPPLRPVQRIERPLSAPEHFFASMGCRSKTLVGVNEVRAILLLDGQCEPMRWRHAWTATVAANPGLRVRLRPGSWPPAWQNEGPLPSLRFEASCEWDVRSQQGAAFIGQGALSLESGPCAELIVGHRSDGHTVLVLRALHAVMDGGGSLHALRELMRAMRGEPLRGTNADFSDVDLMRSLRTQAAPWKRSSTCTLTGLPRTTERGDSWRRISLGRAHPHMLARTVAAMAAFAHRYSERPALVGISVDLRRHCPGLLSTMNFSNMLLVPLPKGGTADAFRESLRQMLDERRETAFPKALDAFCWLPMSWADTLLAQTSRRIVASGQSATLAISNMGRLNSDELSAAGLRVRLLAFDPWPGAPFAILTGIDDRVELIVSLPPSLAAQGRFDELERHLRNHLADETGDTVERNKPLADRTEPAV